MLTCICSLKKEWEGEFLKTYLKSCNAKQESKHIDANNIYGFPISNFPPPSGLKWIIPKEFDLNKINIPVAASKDAF